MAASIFESIEVKDARGLDQLHGIPAIALLACTFVSLTWLTSREVKRERFEKERRRAHELRHEQPSPPSTTSPKPAPNRAPDALSLSKRLSS